MQASLLTALFANMQMGLLQARDSSTALKSPEATTEASKQQLPPPAYVWHALAQLHGLHAQPAPDPEHAGSFVVAATVFPSPKLQPHAAVLSSSLAASLGRPASGTDLVVYPWPAAAQAPVRPSQVQHMAAAAEEGMSGVKALFCMQRIVQIILEVLAVCCWWVAHIHMHTDCSRVSSCIAQDPQAIANGNSSAPSQPVEIAAKVYLRQPLDAARKAPAQMRAGASSPSMLSRPLSAQSREAQEQHRSMLQVAFFKAHSLCLSTRILSVFQHMQV